MNKKLYKLMNWPEIEGITYLEESDPFKVLGAKITSSGMLFQFFYPNAKAVNLITQSGKLENIHKMELADDMGFFALLLPDKKVPEYEYEVILEDKTSFRIKDAYRYNDCFLNDNIISKFKAGTLYDAYKYFGCHIMKINGVIGAKFSVWAPCATRVSVVGSFNNFNNGVHQMKKNADSGVFELFIPGAKVGDLYRYEIRSNNGTILERNDPFAFKHNSYCDDIYSEIIDVDKLFEKEKADYKLNNTAISICEIDLAKFGVDEKGNFLTFKEISKKILDHVKEYGYTHIELLPLLNYFNMDSMGYHTYGYYSFINNYGEASDFKDLIIDLHANNIGIIMDWTCAYFDPTEGGLGRFDGTALYEHLDYKKGVNPTWGTYIFNYGRPEVTSFLISNALYLINELGLDGLCVDSLSSMLYLDYDRNVGEWIPNQYGGNENLEAIEFVKHLNSIISKNTDAIMVARETAAYPQITDSLDNNGLGFTFKFNNGFMDDLLKYMSIDPLFRSANHNDLTLSMIYQYSEKYINGINHDYTLDKTIVDYMNGSDELKLSNLRLLYSYIFTHPGRKILQAGLEMGRKLTHDKGLRKLCSSLNKLYKENKALYELDDYSEGFEWINSISKDKCMISFMRKATDINDTLIVVANFAGVEQKFDIGTPLAGKYKEIFNSDDKEYGGKKSSRTKSITVSENGIDGREYAISVKLNALSLAVYKYVPFTEKEKFQIEKKKEAAIANTKALEFKNLAKAKLDELNVLKKQLDELNKKMNDIEDEIAKATENEKKELIKAQKALNEIN